eukprot:TRINITY_DN4931_c0_g2_i2.p1 TRINITY_DN4931_c0_g2~~TRINITY_DN4931_c0_g2_i2.p1  ORF type:complete len:232 (-),score=40.41 TRINITY_DN4931_c0_g2_i2:1300-1995(-)
MDKSVDAEAKQKVNSERKDHSAELIQQNQNDVEAISGYAPKVACDREIASRVRLVCGSIVDLRVDAVVNAANESLLGGGGVDQAIHARAGEKLRQECATFPIDRNGERCPVGKAVVTKGYNLPAKWVVHTVAPLLTEAGDAQPDKLLQCYKSCLACINGTDLRSIAFCCLGTGYYAFPMVAAAKIALSAAKEFLKEKTNQEKVDEIVFCVYTDLEQAAYKKLFPVFFGKDA